MDGFKECSQCKEIKPLDEFYASPTKKGGYYSHCKECQRKRVGSQKGKYKGFRPEKEFDYELVNRIKREYWAGEWHKHFKIYK